MLFRLLLLKSLFSQDTGLSLMNAFLGFFGFLVQLVCFWRVGAGVLWMDLFDFCQNLNFLSYFLFCVKGCRPLSVYVILSQINSFTVVSAEICQISCFQYFLHLVWGFLFSQNGLSLLGLSFCFPWLHISCSLCSLATVWCQEVVLLEFSTYFSIYR